MSKLLKSPCKDCPYRTVGCHSKCGAYNDFVEYRSNVKSKARAFLIENKIFIDSIKKAYYRTI